ncbi:hypothetical protein AYO41_00930 [Verrucomicrobia bacterium SCGC AG-212-E04]|nr:hypothetical protein AYO41_00930 [Verrucomicrobia bacterium SCGC AG-212-E04]
MTERFVPGAEIDGFTLGERLHAGAMGDLFFATHPQHASTLVMKAPRFRPGDSMENLLGFETESMILPQLSGAHVPRLIAAGDLTRTPYLVLEQIAGENLEALVRRGPLPVAEVARLGAAIADALHAIHRQEVIHFDLKPDNIMVRPNGSAVLIDFGLAHHARYPDLHAEEKRYAAGSAPYVSPEQVEGSRDDPRSDLFALGIVLYEMATAELPFGVPVSMAGLRDRLWVDPKPPRARVSAIPPWLQEIILRCLEIEVGARYQTAAHVAFDLRHPEQVSLTGRAERVRQAGVIAQAGRWWRARERGQIRRARRAPVPNATPVIMVAIDTVHPDDERHAALRRATEQVLAGTAEFRLVCISVLGLFGDAGGTVPADADADLHLEHLIRLRHWVDPLKLPTQRLSLHVLESLSPSAGLLDFARRNHADLIILGAPGAAQRGMAWWRSVASTVAANAPCSVHLVRVPERREAGIGGDVHISLDDLPQ